MELGKFPGKYLFRYHANVSNLVSGITTPSTYSRDPQHLLPIVSARRRQHQGSVVVYLKQIIFNFN